MVDCRPNHVYHYPFLYITVRNNNNNNNNHRHTVIDYIRGLLAASITIFCFFLIWSLLLILFKCCCFGRPAFDKSNNKTRWLSGKPFIVNHKPVVAEDKDPDAHQEWDKQYRNVRRILFWCRATVLFAGMSIIISAVVMSIQGTNSLTQSLESGRTSIGLVHDLASEAVDIIDSVVAQNEKVAKDIFKLLEDFNTMCPLIRDPLCDDLTDLTTCNISGFLGDDLDNIIQMAIEHFNAGERSVVYQEIIKVRVGKRRYGVFNYPISYWSIIFESHTKSFSPPPVVLPSLFLYRLGKV